MQLKYILSVSLLISSAVSAPQPYDQPAQVTFADTLSSSPLSFGSVPAKPVFEWIHSALSSVLPNSQSSNELSNRLAFDAQYSSLGVPDYSDKTIWQVIQENEHLTDLKRLLNYSGPATKELLNDKDKKLTFLIPVNWDHHRYRRDDYEPGALTAFDMSQWAAIEAEIQQLESEQIHAAHGSHHSDDEQKKRRLKALAYIIDATMQYHAIHSDQPLKAWDVAQKSSVPTLFHIGKGKARKVLGNLFDGYAFRLRVGKSVIPRPSIYFNFYSRLVYPDVNVGGSSVHAISVPLFIPPSALQTLFFATPELAATSTALQKTHSAGYFRYPFNHSALHEHGDHLSLLASHQYTSPIPLDGNPDSLYTWRSKFGIEKDHEHEDKRPGHDDNKLPKFPPHPRGQTAITLFTPSNLAWYRLPPTLKLFLMSPFGVRLLSKVMALHTLPHTIFYADFLHTHFKSNVDMISHESMPASQLLSSDQWLWGPTSDQPSAIPLGEANITRYTFRTACPKLHYNHTENLLNDDGNTDKIEFETVDVNVYRYHILPGGRGPLQTRVSVQGVPVVFHDIPVGNGALHTIDRFIMPKGHPRKGIWAQIESEAYKYGYGEIDWQAGGL